MDRTDWEHYYSSPMPTASLARAVVRRHVLRMFRLAGVQKETSIAELGGGGSCFCEAIRARFQTDDYTVYDSSRAGIAEFLKKNPNGKTVLTDLLQWIPDTQYDLVFSVGLIEHFTPEQTAVLIRKHFDMTKSGGHAVFFVPTPTMIYRITRALAETFRLWQFPDERPLLKEEVRKTADLCGTYLNGHTTYANFLSQYAVIYRKN